MMNVQRAEEKDAERLRLSAISAFMVDERDKPFGAKSGGPPGHDLIQQHLSWMKKHDYFKCLIHHRIAGGCIVKKHAGHYELFGIFLGETYIGKGIGSVFLRRVMRRYPTGSEWILETPDYSTRNHRFYERNGFVYSKRIGPDPDLGYGFIEYKKVSRPDV